MNLKFATTSQKTEKRAVKPDAKEELPLQPKTEKSTSMEGIIIAVLGGLVDFDELEIFWSRHGSELPEPNRGIVFDIRVPSQKIAVT